MCRSLRAAASGLVVPDRAWRETPEVGHSRPRPLTRPGGTSCGPASAVVHACWRRVAHLRGRPGRIATPADRTSVFSVSRGLLPGSLRRETRRGARSLGWNNRWSRCGTQPRPASARRRRRAVETLVAHGPSSRRGFHWDRHDSAVRSAGRASKKPVGSRAGLLVDLRGKEESGAGRRRALLLGDDYRRSRARACLGPGDPAPVPEWRIPDIGQEPRRGVIVRAGNRAASRSRSRARAESRTRA